MIKNVRFRYNKYTPGILYIMLIVGVSLGFLSYYLILKASGIWDGPETEPAYFSEHPNHAVYLIFGLIPIVMLLPAWIVAKCWGSRDEEAQLDLYEDYAVLRMGNREIRIEKGKLRIKIPEPHPHWYLTYILKFPDHRIVLVTSVKESKEKRSSWLSLDKAMGELSAYRKSKR